MLLLYLEFPNTSWTFKHALKFIHKKAANVKTNSEPQRIPSKMKDIL